MIIFVLKSSTSAASLSRNLLTPFHTQEQDLRYSDLTHPFKMLGPFWSVWCKMALTEVGVSLP